MPAPSDPVKYNQFISRLRQSHLGYKMPESQKKSISHALTGRVFSDEHKKNLSKAIKGKPRPWMVGRPSRSAGKTWKMSVEGRKKISLSQTGKNNSMYGKVPWNKNKNLHYKVWNDGLKGYHAGKEHHRFGKNVSDDVKKKISDTIKCRWVDSKRENGNYGMSNKFHSLNTRKKMSDAKMGPKSFRWKDGLCQCPYGFGWREVLKEQVRERFGRVCVISLEPENGNRLSVHHIDGDKNNHSLDNLIPLQGWIHAVIHADEGFWEGTPYLKIGR